MFNNRLIKYCICIFISLLPCMALALDFTLSQQIADNESQALALGDFDGDGNTDAFVANVNFSGIFSNNANTVRSNNGSSFFSNALLLGQMNSVDVAIGDLDGDGDLDAFVANINTDGNKFDQVWVNQSSVGSISFANSGQQLGNADSMKVKLGDLDGDGDLDAIVIQTGEDAIWLNQGGLQTGVEGEFQLGSVIVGGTNTRGLSLADLDGDGDLDLVFAVSNGADEIWINQGGSNLGIEGEFLKSLSVLSTTSSSGLGIGDLDNDGDLDIISTPAFPETSSRIWINLGGIQGGLKGTFQEGSPIISGGSNDLILKDFDEDGWLDIFFLNGPNPNKIWVNNKNLTFADSNLNFNLPQATGVASADFDHDGDLDLMITNDGGVGTNRLNDVWVNESNLSGVPNADLSVIVFPGNHDTDYDDGAGDHEPFIIEVTNLGPNDSHNALISWSGDTYGSVSGTNITCTQEPSTVRQCTVSLLQVNQTMDIIISQPRLVNPSLGAHFVGSRGINASIAASLELDNKTYNNSSSGNINYYQCIGLCFLSGLFCDSNARTPDNNAHKELNKTSSYIPKLTQGYRLRHLMSLTNHGSQLTNLYYQHSPEMLTLVATDPLLNDKAMQFLESREVNFYNLVEFSGVHAIISSEQITKLDDFITSLSAAGSAQLQQDIQTQRNLIGPFNDYIGLTMVQAKDLVIPGDVISRLGFEQIQLE